MVFLASGLVDAVKHNHETGIPKLIGHDVHRPVGFIFPFAVYMEPHISRMLGRGVIPTNQEEQDQISALHQQHIKNKNEKKFKQFEKDFLKIIGSHLTDNHMRIDAGCAAIYQKNIACQLFPKLFAEKDDVGLIPLSILLENFNYQGQGIFKNRHSELSVFADVNFRRRQSIHNNFHFYFLNELIWLFDQKNISIKIRIDENLLGYAPSYHDSIELEYHWGPKFNDDISTIKPGLTRYECSTSDRYFYGLSRTEFYWKEDKNEKTFELEELRDQTAPQDGDELYNCRYIHSIYDTDKKTFFHFDGAIRSYGLEEMSDRLDKNFLEYGRKAAYKKLFRIDGSLSLASWKTLTIHYMQGNPLMYEYFGLEKEYESLKIKAKEIEPLKKILPFEISANSGIRILISYNSIPQSIKEGRQIEAYYRMGSNLESFEYVEYTICEIQKAFRRNGFNLEIPEEVSFLKIADRYWNIPAILHHGYEAPTLLNGTVQTYIQLFEAMISKGFDKDIAFTLGITIDNQLLKVSLYGNIKPLLEWMKNALPFPSEEKAFYIWVNTQRKYLEKYDESSDDPSIAALVELDGSLRIKRPFVPYPYKFELQGTSIVCNLEFPEEDQISEMIEKGLIIPAMIIKINKMVLSDTEENYLTSDRSVWLDSNNNFNVIISNWEPLALCWTKE